MTRHERPTQRAILSICAALALAAGGAQAGSAAARSAAAPVLAGAARTVTVNDTGYLHLVHASGEILIEEGSVSGTLPGTAKVRLEIGATEVRASFRIKPTSGGSIVGTGRAKISSSARYSSFAGTLSVTGGTGRYDRARGSGKLYGKLERKSDDLTVQTREGTLDY